MKLKDISAKFKSIPPKKKTQYLAVVIVIAVILAIYFSTLVPSEEQPPEAARAAELEERLEEVLSGVEGAGKVSVVINYASSAEIVPAKSVNTQMTDNTGDNGSASTLSESTDIVVSANGDTVVLKEVSPEVCGVIVVAEGADDIGVRMSLMRAVTTLLDIDVKKVEVLKHASD